MRNKKIILVIADPLCLALFYSFTVLFFNNNNINNHCSNDNTKQIQKQNKKDKQSRKLIKQTQGALTIYFKFYYTVNKHKANRTGKER